MRRVRCTRIGRCRIVELIKGFRLARSNRGQGTTAIDVAGNPCGCSFLIVTILAIDFNLGRTRYGAGRAVAILLCVLTLFNRVFSDTRTGTEDMAAMASVITRLTRNISLIYRHMGTSAHMAVLTTSIDGAVDSGTRISCKVCFCGFACEVSTFLANCDNSIVHIAHKEVGNVFVAGRVSNGHSRLTTAAAKDRSVGDAVGGVKACIASTNGTAKDSHRGLTAAREIGIRPKRPVDIVILRRQFAVAASRVVVRAAGIVALTHGGHVAATIDEPAHVATVHRDRGVAIDLAGRPATHLFGIRLYAARCRIQQLRAISARTLTAAKYGVSYLAVMDGDAGILIDVAVFATAIHRTSSLGSYRWGITRTTSRSYCDMGLTDVGTEGLDVALFSDVVCSAIFGAKCYLALTTAIYIFGNSAVIHIHSSDTTDEILKIAGDIRKLVRPAQTKVIEGTAIGSLAIVLLDIGIRILLILIVKVTTILLFHAIVYHTHTGQLTTAIDSLYRTVYKSDRGIATYAACPLHGRVGEITSGPPPMHFNSGRVLIVVTAVTTAKDVAVDSWST